MVLTGFFGELLTKSKSWLHLANCKTNLESKILQALLFTQPTQTYVAISRKQPFSKFTAKKEVLPFPQIETFTLIDLEFYRKNNFKQAKYGDFEFLECPEGFVQMYVQGYINQRDLDAIAGYGVFYGENHPFGIDWGVDDEEAVNVTMGMDHSIELMKNTSGPVEHRQSLNHSKLYGVTKAINQIPKNLFPKVCVCVDEANLITFISTGLEKLSQNAFRSALTGKLNKDMATNTELNNLLRTRQDLTLRMRYVPNDIHIDGMREAKQLARRAASQATELVKQNKRLQTIIKKN